MTARPARAVLYVAEGCHLCDAALEVVESVRRETPFALDVVDITGDDELEREYRAEIPVLELDGVQAFRYVVTADGLRDRLHGRAVG
jgi:hypothetical protein